MTSNDSLAVTENQLSGMASEIKCFPTDNVSPEEQCVLEIGQNDMNSNSDISLSPAESPELPTELPTEEHTVVSHFKQMKLEKEAQKNWDLFYKRNTTNFFKDRHWTTREFEELKACRQVVMNDDAVC